MCEELMVIKSHKGQYGVTFCENSAEHLVKNLPEENYHIIIDRRVAELNPPNELLPILEHSSVLQIEALENNKSLEVMPDYVAHLVSKQIRKDDILIAIGGGIIQDITCFLSATLLRGVDWYFYPTTLLAQADSCIGSKSSINCAGVKNILGTFTPPKTISIASSFLQTLEDKELRSGVGEMLKVHAIEGRECLRRFAKDYDELFISDQLMSRAIRNSLEIKKRYIEKDEFDKGDRLVFNYGHSFGHAIEAATNYAVPHGIAVSMGCDMANFVSAKMDLAPSAYWREMSPTYRKNYGAFSKVHIPFDDFLVALAKDKKNVEERSFALILPNRKGEITRGVYADTPFIRSAFQEFLGGLDQQV